jgi:hypothetical protein
LTIYAQQADSFTKEHERGKTLSRLRANGKNTNIEVMNAAPPRAALFMGKISSAWEYGRPFYGGEC